MCCYDEGCYPWGGTPPQPETVTTTQCVPILRYLLNDLNPNFYEYQNSILTGAVAAALALNKLPGFTLSADGVTITPQMYPNGFALLNYKTAKLFLSPQPKEYQFKSRAFSEKIGDWSRAIIDLDKEIYEIESGAQMDGWQNFYSFLAGISGLSLLEVFTRMRVNAPFYTITLTATGGTAAS